MTKVKKTTDVKGILSGYVPPEDNTVPKVIAHLADYCATRMPKQPIPWQWVVKICNGRKTLPPEDCTEVKNMKSRLARARVICREDFKRDILHIPGFGIRGTTDDEDMGRNPYVKAARRVVSSSKTFLQIKDLIDPTKIKDKELREYVTNGNAVSKLLEQKILPALDRPKEEPVAVKDEEKK
jgi:hypothetical protein